MVVGRIANTYTYIRMNIHICVNARVYIHTPTPTLAHAYNKYKDKLWNLYISNTHRCLLNDRQLTHIHLRLHMQPGRGRAEPRTGRLPLGHGHRHPGRNSCNSLPCKKCLNINTFIRVYIYIYTHIYIHIIIMIGTFNTINIHTC